jgi:Cu/Ag efflux protein CusF
MAVPTRPLPGAARVLVPFRLLAAFSLALLLWSLPCRTTLGAQEQHKSKVPVIDKITSGGPTHQQFSGIVRSIDLESEILNVDTVKGNVTEIFPVKKKVHVVTADGSKLKLTKLKPGANVLIYYEQKGDHKTVTEIVVLAGGEVKKKTPPS